MYKKLEIHELKNFHPFHLVDDDQLWMIACSVEIKKVAANEQLFQCGDEDDREYYLLDGELELKAADGLVKNVKAGELVAKHPVARLRPRRYAAVSKVPSVLFTVHRDVLAALHAGSMDIQNISTAYSVDEILDADGLQNSESEINQTVMAAIVHDLKVNTFVLPNYPGVNNQILEMLHVDDSASIEDIADIAYRDPATVTKLMKAANSSIYRAAGPCETLLDGIARLGPNTAKQLIHCYVTRDAFHSNNAYLNELLAGAWHDSVRVSSIVGLMAKVIPGFDEPVGRLAGSMHLIGTLSLLPYFEKYASYFNTSESVDAFIETMAGPVGELVLSHYGISERLVDVSSHSIARHKEGNQSADYCDLVIVATLHNRISQGMTKCLPKLQSVPAFQKLAAMRVTPELMIKVISLVNKQTIWLSRYGQTEEVANAV